MSKDDDKELFNKLKADLMNIDPVYFCQKYLTLDGKPFTLTGNGYKPFADIYRYVGIKALEPDSKPLIIVKGRQIGATTMASALEMYFMGSGLFGTGTKPAIRIMHAFPQLELAAAYSKTKLSQIINSSLPVPNPDGKGNSRTKSYMQSLLDQSNSTNDSLHFKQFVGGNHLWIESVGLDGDRIMGRTTDVLFFDECFPANQQITTIDGKFSLYKLYNLFINNKPLPMVKSFNENTQSFEYKKITNVFKRGINPLIELNCSGRKIKCTPNHKFLTEYGWKEAQNIKIGTLLKSSIDTAKFVRSINDDQKQVILGSFLGDGHIRHIDKSRFRLSIIHGINQENYCKWKADIFNVKTVFVEKNGYSNKQAIKFTTKSFGLNKNFPLTKTSCPQWVLDEIDARGIAIWFMDDGSKNNKTSVTLSTCSFDEDSQKRIVKKFNDLGIPCFYKKYSNYYSVYFKKIGSQALYNLIRPFIHDNLLYKIDYQAEKYSWNNKYNEYSWQILNSVTKVDKKMQTYDIEVEDNHNFVLAPNKDGITLGGLIAHNCQKTTSQAIGNSLKILTTSKYGKPSKGVQIYFGTPRRKGSDFYKMWQRSSQQYYYLGCQNCNKHFPLYTPGSDDWKKIWIHTKIVKCVHCGHEQNKLEAAERGKWIALKSPDEPDCDMIGFHMNQLYMPMFTREDIDNETPGKHPINTERVFQNEVLGEFFQGDSSPITNEEIQALCGDTGRKYSARITPDKNEIVVMGIDYGARADLEQMSNPDKKAAGQSYSTAVILLSKGPGLLSIEYATKFKRNDIESKKGLIDQLMRQYGVNLTIGDIGYSNDFSNLMHTAHGDKYLVSRAHNKVNNHVKYTADAYPKEIVFERDFYIGELYEQMKKGMIRFPYGDFEKVGWLIDHCASMEIKPSISRGGDPSIHYVKGGTPNDGFMALLNAYIAYKFIVTSGFTNNNPLLQDLLQNRNKPLVLSGYVPRKI